MVILKGKLKMLHSKVNKIILQIKKYIYYNINVDKFKLGMLKVYCI